MTLPDTRPPRGPASGAPRRRGALIAALLTTALVIAVVVVAVALMNRKDPTGSAAGGQTSGSPSTSAPASKRSTGDSSPPASKTSQSSSAQSSTAQSTASSAAGGAPTAAQLAQALTDYYALIPGNLAAGWARLTPSYQQITAGGYSGYQQFWSQFDRVTVTEVSAQPPERVQAKITYFSNGKPTSVEVTTFQLVRSGGILKINDSSTGG